MFPEPQPAKLTHSQRDILVLGFLSNGDAIWVAADGEVSITEDSITFPWRFDAKNNEWVDAGTAIDNDDKEA